MQQTLQLLGYLATQEDAILSYHASDMVLAVNNNASYLSDPKACSRAVGHFFLSSITAVPPNNGAVLNIAHIIKDVVSSATEAELVRLHIMSREAVYIRTSNRQCCYKPTKQWQTPSSMTKYNQNKPRQWTCGSTG
jgi:hypothetical protein